MKRLMWTLLSLMLFLGVGTAFAQPSTPVLISPLDNATVAPGQALQFAKNTDYKVGTTGTGLIYTFDAAASLNLTASDVPDIMEAAIQGKDVDGVYGCMLSDIAYSDYDPSDPTVVIANWMPTPTIPLDASGTVTLKARAMNFSNGQLSSEITATYTVGAAASVPAPTFNPPAGEVEEGAEVKLVMPTMESDGNSYQILYVLDDENHDFARYKCQSDDMCEDGPVVPTKMVYGMTTHINITKDTKVTAILMKYDGFSERILGWSKPVSADYTIKAAEPTPAEKPAKPTFTPAGGNEVEPGTKVTITAAEDADDIWFCIDCEDTDLTEAGHDQGKCDEYMREIAINKDQTIKAVAVKGVKPPFILSEVATASYTVSEAANLPILTVTPAGPVQVEGSTVFSCTFDPNGYTHEKAKVGFTIKFKDGDEIKNLEYQVGEEVDPEKWTAYNSNTALPNLKKGTGYAAAPKNAAASDKLIAIEKTTVHYRLTLPATATKEIEAIFEAVEVSSFGFFPVGTYTPMTETSVKFQPVPPAKPTFDPDGGEVELDDEITLSTTTTAGKIYYGFDVWGITESDFTSITTEEDLEASDKVMEGTTFTLEETGEESGDVMVLAATAVVEDGAVVWSPVASKEFTIKEAPGITVDQPVITPDNYAGRIKLNEKVTITCATEGAEIYYTLDGSAPDNTKTKYEAPFLLPEGTPVDQEITIRAIAYLEGVYSDGIRSHLTVEEAEKPAKPTFDPEAGEVAFGTLVELSCETSGAAIYFTIDGTEPTEESEKYSYLSEILITKAMTVKAIAVLGGVSSELAEASYTVAPISAALSISSTMLDNNTVGKNVNVGFSISDPENPESQGWMYTYPAAIYYTVDGETEPSKAAYESQSDKENGAIKMVATQMDEDGYPVTDAYGNVLWLTFAKPTHLKAIGYLTMDGMEIVTSVFDEEINVKSLENPTFSISNYTKVKAGDKLVIKNPAPAPSEDEEGEEGDGEFGGNDGEEVTAEPVGTLYFSFDGTKPTSAGYLAQEEDWDLDKPYSTYKIFKAEGVDVEITFGQDEEGYYVYVPVITEVLYMPGYDTIRLDEDGHFNVEVFAEAAEAIKDPMAWGPAKYFTYGSDFVSRHYTMNEDFPAAELTFDPASGSEVEENTAVTITSDREVEIFYMMFESKEAAEGAAWDQEKAESYSAEMKPVLSVEKNTIKAAYAFEGAEAVAETFFYATYTVKALPAIELTFSPVSGSEVEEGATVSVTASRETAIFYNLYADKAAADADKETFIANAKEVKEDGMPVITKGNTYLRCAVIDRGEMKYFDATYTVKADPEPVVEPVSAPAFSVDPGAVRRGTKVTLSCETEGAVIYYTIDGTEPSEKSIENNAIVINEAMTIKAIAVKGNAKSKVATASYTIDVTANEGEELAGVTVYPNPSNGLFNIELPVAATIEVFMSNGMLYQRVKAQAGRATLNIDRSGIYFLRIAGEGRTALKRVIVR